MKHRVKVTQVLRVERSTVIEVEAPSLGAAIDAVDLGDVEKPAVTDANAWRVERSTVENEEVTAA